MTLGTFRSPLTPLKKATVYIQVELPPLIPPCQGGKKKSFSLPFARGGLGWGKTLLNQLFQTCCIHGSLKKWELESKSSNLSGDLEGYKTFNTNKKTFKTSS
ncbi:hypothetical protein A4S05_31855 [Nostoc sp. KVJ20]|nr:hypothetical protein A4S05_31855 [Nostoc sp. KVJ20]